MEFAQELVASGQESLRGGVSMASVPRQRLN